MEITREAIEKRLAEMNQQRLVLISDLDATLGAIQDCQYWLSVIDAEPETKDA